MIFMKIRSLRLIAAALAVSMLAGIVVMAAEKGEVQIFKLSKTNLAKDQELWDNREFKQREMEYLDRGLAAVGTNNGIFVSWRWLGTESNTVKYNLYRDGEKINAFPLNVTNFSDVNGTTDNTYQVAAIVDGVEQEKCDPVTPWETNKLDIELDIPPAIGIDGEPKLHEDGSPVLNYPNECSVADLDGDGEYEIVLKWEPDDRQDNGYNGLTSPTIIDAYEMDGTRMWRIDLGHNIRSGAHYVQFMVYDLDCDGKGEMVLKTADGTTDNEGNVVGDKNKLWVNTETGRILEGPEYLTLFDAEKGTILDTVEYIPGRGNVADWGDDYGNRSERYLGCVAYLDGEKPSVVMCRGYYERMTLTAWDVVDKKLQMRWAFDTDKNYGEYMSQGNHSVCAADVDYDAKDEIIYGGAVIDDDGTGLYSTGLGHGDAQHTSDLVPSHPGLETFSIHEHLEAEYGVEMRDARTGEILWGSWEQEDVARGVSGDIDPRYPGAESWSSQKKMIASTGEVISDNFSISCNFLIYWDGDLGREVQDGNHIDKWVPEKNKTKMLFSPRGYVSFGGTKAPPGITADLFGDWREETILFSEDRSKMAIFITTDPTDYKIYTLMHDLQYRTYITTQNVGYNQPPHTGYYLGYDTTEIPVSRVRVNNNGKIETNPDLEAGTKYYPIESLKREESVAMLIDKPFAVSNGQMIRIDSENAEVTPFIKNERTLVPLRFIAEAFGATVDWDGDKQEITIKQDKKTIRMNIGSKDYTINRKGAILDAAPEIIGERTFVPLRAVAEALDKKVAWNDGIIYINDTDEEISEDAADIFRKTIINYVEPEDLDNGPMALNTEILNEKQIPVYEVDASTDDGNIAEGAVDSNWVTRWNGYGDGATLTLDLGETKYIAGVAANFYKGETRRYYFDIAVSDDGENWNMVLSDQQSSGSGEAEVLEYFPFKSNVKGRYLRYIGHCSSDNDSNNIYELVVLAP